MKPKGTMDLKGSIIKAHSDPKRKNCFQIDTRARLFLLIAETEKDMKEWIVACKAEQDIVEGRGPKKEDSSSSSEAPPANGVKKEKVFLFFSFLFFF